jgi:hypothetical protein
MDSSKPCVCCSCQEVARYQWSIDQAGVSVSLIMQDRTPGCDQPRIICVHHVEFTRH